MDEENDLVDDGKIGGREGAQNQKEVKICSEHA